MLCEMCGKDVETTSRVRVEGSVLQLCADCARFGVALSPPPPELAPVPDFSPIPPGPGGERIVFRTRRLEERDLFKELPEMELAEDWPRRIRLAREQLTWTPEELGKRLNEKKSVVLKMEAGAMRPPDAMVRKVERLLKIRLRSSPEPAAPA
jgi:putative transcription factor